MLTASRAKKGYYIRRVKDSLWSVFGFNRIKPFGDNYTKEQMKAWKQSKDVKSVHEDLYNPIDPNDASSDSYLTLIFKSVFSAEKERTYENSIWTMSVLEAIFDVDHVSTKIDTDVIESWKNVVEKVILHCFSFIRRRLLNILLYLEE